MAVAARILLRLLHFLRLADARFRFVRACVLQEVAVATLTFTDRASAELHGKLALSALPEWLSIRRRE